MACSAAQNQRCDGPRCFQSSYGPSSCWVKGTPFQASHLQAEQAPVPEVLVPVLLGQLLAGRAAVGLTCPENRAFWHFWAPFPRPQGALRPSPGRRGHNVAGPDPSTGLLEQTQVDGTTWWPCCHTAVPACGSRALGPTLLRPLHHQAAPYGHILDHQGFPRNP